MTFRRTFALALGHLLAWAILLGCGGVMLDANTDTVRTEAPGVVECWDGMQVRTVAGEC
jgi:hypothetical protein